MQKLQLAVTSSGVPLRRIFTTIRYLISIWTEDRLNMDFISKSPLTSSAVSSAGNTKCIEDGKFYRNPERPLKKIWTNLECAKYYLCLEGEVFEFKCSVGLLFDVVRQICDFKANVDNCDVTSGMVKAPPGYNLLLHAVIL